MKYAWKAQGTAHGGQTWATHGTVYTQGAGQFSEALSQAQRDSFQQLTRGRAVFGHPGLGCQGPYTITRFEIAAEQDA